MDQQNTGAPPPAMPESPPPAMPESAPPSPPPVGWTAPPAMSPAGGQVTGLAKIASAILIVVGILASLLGLLFLAGGALVGSAGQTDLGNLAGVFGAVVAVAGVVVLIIGVLQVLSGVGAWRGNGAGRIGGIIFGVLGMLLGLSTLQSEGGLTGGVITLVLFGYVAIVLLFRWKEPATA